VKRSSVVPNVPTVAESGYKDFETTAWWGVFAPANLPADLAAHLAEAVAAVVHGDGFRGKLEPLGVVPVALSRGDFAEFQRRELTKWGRAVRDSGATMD
jgi:tripartite-type tricarboxylate transporter receptor subunit TctC